MKRYLDRNDFATISTYINELLHYLNKKQDEIHGFIRDWNQYKEKVQQY